MSTTLEESKSKPFMKRRRYIFRGYDNYSELEQEWIQKVKVQMKQKHGIDLDKKKAFGPRTKSGAWIEGDSMNKIEQDGTDLWFSDQNILRFIIAREYRLDDIVNDLKSHLEWRQINQPMAVLNEQSLRLLKKGVMYVHGRCKDLTPILVINLAAIGEMMEQDDLCSESYCNLHNFVIGYCEKNMIVPGMVDRWILLIDCSQFGITQFPISMFK